MAGLLDPTTLVRDAHALLSAFVDPATLSRRDAMTRALQPRPEDYARVFTPEMADIARVGYGTLWQGSPQLIGKPGQIHVLVSQVVAAEFAVKTPGTQAFPGGYMEIAKYLQPDRPWFAWKFVVPGERSGMAYDGLVHLDDRFIWLPKPWKILLKGPSPMGHYAN